MKCRVFVSCLWICCFSVNALAVIVPQPIGMFISEVDGIALVDDVSVDSRALLAHQEKVREVAEFQSLVGAYDASLSDLWLDLAHEAVRLQQPLPAASFFQQGLHNLRLNSGLTTQRQVAALTAWISVLRRLDDDDALTEQLQYRYRITGFGLAPWREEALSYALEYYDDVLLRFASRDWLSIEKEVIRFDRHLDDVIEKACESEVAEARWCSALVKRRLQLLYLISYAVEPIVEDRQSRSLVAPKLLPQQSIYDEQLVVLERNAYSSGVRMLEHAIDLASGDPELEVALADWRWFFGRRGAARKIYQRLHQSNPEFFGSAQALPHDLVENQRSTGEGEVAFPKYRFTVSKLGQVREIQLVAEEKPPENVIRVRRSLRNVRFRPALNDNGEPVSSQLSQRFRYTR